MTKRKKVYIIRHPEFDRTAYESYDEAAQTLIDNGYHRASAIINGDMFTNNESAVPNILIQHHYFKEEK